MKLQLDAAERDTSTWNATNSPDYICCCCACLYRVELNITLRVNDGSAGDTCCVVSFRTWECSFTRNALHLEKGQCNWLWTRISTVCCFSVFSYRSYFLLPMRLIKIFSKIQFGAFVHSCILKRMWENALRERRIFSDIFNVTLVRLISRHFLRSCPRWIWIWLSYGIPSSTIYAHVWRVFFKDTLMSKDEWCALIHRALKTWDDPRVNLGGILWTSNRIVFFFFAHDAQEIVAVCLFAKLHCLSQLRRIIERLNSVESICRWNYGVDFVGLAV